MIIVLYVFLGLCAFFIGLPLALFVLHVALVSLSKFLKRIGEKARIELQLMNLEQCRDCKYNDHIYNDRSDPTLYGVCCTHDAALFRYKFIEDPGDKCKHHEKKDEVNP
jgi:hypothetical protein